MVVDIRSMARTLFDASLDPNRKNIIDSQISKALAATSNAITKKIDLVQSNSRVKQIDTIAKDLRRAADDFTEEIVKMVDVLPRTQFVRCIALVDNIKIIANSLDESSPAILSVPTPGEPSSVRVIGSSSITRFGRLGSKTWLGLRTFLRR